ncbi:endonuclease MutS2 [Cuneatibacter caecimuris]|uniref:DsDNA-specific endonuclease/ATPase MutS2 n=1 Tax=Cuneatibacter caecimuris TaxID=1796618 RepID=A0A4Q7PNS9_9FIRM|nr:DNA mismatch repair protein MutS [Cuneatibacter caecimuris]RZT02612.1 dsDNA-specific endonuclease/ATPase MutS2 [Cuneatibacter caecimuris]
MDQSLKTIGYNQIIEKLKEYACSGQAKEMAEALRPYRSYSKLAKNMRDTTQARKMLEEAGSPPLPIMENIEEYLERSVRGDLLLPEQIEQTGGFLVAVRRLKSYLENHHHTQMGIAFYSDNLNPLTGLQKEIERSIRGGKIDDYASVPLRNIRRQIQLLREKIREKAEQALSINKKYAADSFVAQRGGRLCIPVKKEFKSKVPGIVVDQSSTGSTFFIEPKAAARLREEYELYQIQEDTEERRILYSLMEQIALSEAEIREDIRVIILLDFMFAKGKMSMDMNGVEPEVNLERRIFLEKARHPMLPPESCVPLDFEISTGKRGMVITGPNTGGKTVTIKTAALLSAMACSGLHIPCQRADIAMNSQILCDIGDGQNISDNLSTFSAHIKNILEILTRADRESLVILDELGSGTDPAEGMGIAVAILDELRQSGALFLVTTHYPEVKEYAKSHEEIINARMAFDRESLKPLYRLEMGKSGESCALYIAKRLGIPNQMLRTAARAAYGSQADRIFEDLNLEEKDAGLIKKKMPGIEGEKNGKKEAVHGTGFARGDSVTILPENKIGIVVKPADRQGNVLVQIQKEKVLVNHKRLKLKVAATELYPEDYDFSIVFDTVENRKARHMMERKYQEGLSIELESPN